MAKLTDLGFLKGVYSETIVSTYNSEGTPNAAPMGAIMQNDQNVTLNIFDSSMTRLNLAANKCAVINLTNNIEVFYKTVFKEANPNGKLPEEWFERAKTVNAPKLRSAEAAIEVSVIDMEPSGLARSKFLCNVIQIYAPKKYPKVYCRAMSTTVEAITQATRVKVFIEEKKQKQVNELLGIIEDQKDFVDRVAPNSTYSFVMDDLIKRIHLWKNKK